MDPTIYAAARVGAVQDYLFNDVTTGDNSFTFAEDDGNTVRIPGFSARRGWDAATGFGSPKADHLVPFLAATN